MKKWLFLLFIFIYALKLYAQNNFFSRLNQYTTDNGLAHNSGNCFIQDEYGFIWIGSNSGLERFDGYEFRIYQSDYQDSTAITNSRITALLIDKHNTLWIGTSGGGLNQYNRKADKFLHIHSVNDGGILSSDYITFIVNASGNKLWIGTLDNGLNLFNPVTNTNKIFARESGTNSLNSNEVNCGSFDNNGNLWVGGLIGINVIDTTKNEVRNYYKIPGDLTFFNKMVIRSMSKDKEGNIWIGTWINGVFKVDFVTGTIISVPSIPNNAIVYDIIPVTNYGMAIATNKGLFFADADNYNWKQLKHELFNAQSNDEDTYISLYQDRSGILWIGTINNGIINIDLHQKKFELFRENNQSDNSISSNLVNGIEEDWSGNIWLSTYRGINKFNPKNTKFEALHFLDKYNDDKVNVSRKGTYPFLWVGTDYGLIKLNVNNGQYDRYEINTDYPNCLHNNVINTLLYDSIAEYLWIGTWGGGLDLFDIKNNTWKNYPIDSTDFNNNVVLTMTKDTNGMLWLGTFGNGLLIFNPGSEKFKSISLIDGDTRDQVIISLFNDSKQRLWIGTSTEGLLIYDRAHTHFVKISIANGLPSNEITGILENKNGEYWISSSKGITRIYDNFKSAGNNQNETEKVVLHHFDFRDGLQANAFNREALLKSSSGKFYFGGNNGFNAFYPDSIRLNPFHPNQVFTSFEIMGQQLNPGDKYNERIVLTDPIYATEAIVLTSSDKLFSLGLSAMHYAIPEKNMFAYKLENFNEEWIYTDPKRRFITFSDLKEGDYTLKLLAANNDGIWNNQAAILKIKVLPAWWNTKLFKTILLSTFLLLVFGFIKYRTHSLKKQRQLLKRIIQERTSEIIDQKNNIQVQNEELMTMNEKISLQAEQLSRSHNELEQINLKLKRTQNELKTINKNLELTVRKRTAELEKKIKELDHFIYRASHDLSAPLKSILGLVHLTRLDQDQSDLQLKLNFIESSVNKLENVIFSLKQFSQNSGLKLIKKKINLLSFVWEILESMRFVDHFKQMNIRINIDPKLEFFTDDSRLRSILSNLIDNAIKYHDPAKSNQYLNIDAQIRWDFCFIKISDNGIGVEKNMLDNVFNMFFRANIYSEGSGLGLYIVKECMMKLEGSIKMKSQVNQGTTILLRLPIH